MLYLTNLIEKWGQNPLFRSRFSILGLPPKEAVNLFIMNYSYSREFTCNTELKTVQTDNLQNHNACVTPHIYSIYITKRYKAVILFI